jgi:hypothetical protein
METILDIEKPDFAVLNGDLINGDSTQLHNSTEWVDMIIKPLVDRSVTWGSAYGNHDHQPNLQGDLLLEREQLFPGVRTTKMVQGENAGTTNYYLPVYPAGCVDKCKCKPELILWFFDSRGGYYFQKRDKKGRPVHHPNWVDDSVVKWFEETNAKLQSKYKTVIPSLGFVHIPLYAMVKLQDSGVDPNRQPGINDENASPQAQGWCVDGTRDWDSNCKYGLQDVPLMQAIAKTKGIMGLFSGHDHANSWCHKWSGKLPDMTVEGNGINLCFGQHTGYGGYGNWIRGSRELFITRENLKNLVVDSHIRLESGDVVGDISLNSTYGNDLYPATPNDKTYL